MTNDEIARYLQILDHGGTLDADDQKRLLKDLHRSNRVVLAFKRSVDPQSWPLITRPAGTLYVAPLASGPNQGAGS